MKQMLGISDFSFSVKNNTDFHQFTRTAESGLAQQSRGGMAPATQQTGRPLQTISINGQILGRIGGAVLDQLRQFVNAGPQTLTISGVRQDNATSGQFPTGSRYLGQWNVTRVTETGTRLIDDGTALKTEFTVELQEYQP